MMGQSVANASLLICFIFPVIAEFGTREGLISGVNSIG